MEKTSIKRLGYGFSALVMSISAVNFMPAFSNAAYAEVVTTTTVDAADDIKLLEDDDVVSLTQDLEIVEDLALNGTNITIDLNGHNIKVSSSVTEAFDTDVIFTGTGKVTGTVGQLANVKAQGGTWDYKVETVAGYTAYAQTDGTYVVDATNVADSYELVYTAAKAGEAVSYQLAEGASVSEYSNAPKFTAKKGANEVEGFTLDTEAKTISISEEVADGIYDIILKDVDTDTELLNAKLTVYSFESVKDIDARVDNQVILATAFENKSAKMPTITYALAEDYGADKIVLSNGKITGKATGTYDVNYEIQGAVENSTTTGVIKVVVSPANNEYDSAALLCNLGSTTAECNPASIDVDANFIAEISEEDAEEAAEYIELSQEEGSDTATVNFLAPYWGDFDFTIGNSVNKLTVHTFNITETVNVEAGGTVTLADLYKTYGNSLTNVKLKAGSNGTLNNGAGVKTEDGVTRPKSDTYIAPETAGTDVIVWNFQGGAKAETKINVYAKADNQINPIYESVENVAGTDYTGAYNKSNNDSTVIASIDGVDTTSDEFEAKVGKQTLTFTETLNGEDINTATATIFVTGINAQEVELKTEEEFTIDLTSEEVAYGIELSSVEAVNSSDLTVSKQGEGIYKVSATEEGTYTMTFTVKEKTAEDTYNGNGVYTFTFTVSDEEEPVEYTLEVEADKSESDEVKIDEEITFTWESNGTLLVSIDGGEAEEDTESAENDGGEFIAKFATAGEHTVTVSLKEDASQTKTFTFNVVEDEPEEKTASLDVEESATTAKVGETVTFTITAEPAAEGDKVTVKVNDGEAEEVEGDTYTFTAEEAGEYTFVFALDGAEEVTKTVTVEAEEEPTPADPRPEDLEVKNDTILVSLDQVNGKTFSVDTDYEIEVIECQTAEENCEGLEIKIAEDGKSYTIDSLANAGEYTLSFYHEFDEGKTLVATTTVVVYDIEEDTSENANETLNAIVAGLESVIAETAGEESTIEGLVEKLNALENVDELLGKVAGESRDDKLTALAAIVDKISNGETLTTEVTGTDQALEDSEVDAEAKDSILEKLSAEGINYDGISYYDIDVIVKDENGTELAALSELDNKVTIAIAVGEDPEGTSRSYYVVRFHDGVAEIIAEGLEATDGMITFASDKFSTYAVAYTEEDMTTPTDPTEPTESTDTEGTTDSTSGKKGKKTAKTPDTGVATAGISSATASAIISGLATASLIALVGAVKFAKRNK